MKISYQQLLVLLVCFSSQLSATTLHNNSDYAIKYNIFNKRWLQFYAFCKPFPKHRGTLQPHTSQKIKDLDPKADYVVTFYDVHNALHNQRHTIKGNRKKLVFDAHSKITKELPAFIDMQ